MTKAQSRRRPGAAAVRARRPRARPHADALWEAAIGDLRVAWSSATARRPGTHRREYDEYSLYEFLREKGWSRGAIEYFTVFNFLESDMHNSLVEILREDLGGAYVDMQEIAGGMDAPAQRVLRRARGQRSGSARTCSRWTRTPDGVTVHFKTESGRFSVTATTRSSPCRSPVLRTIEIARRRSRAGKQRAIRQLNYHASTKILFQVRERIWETEDGILGGGTVTELPDPADELPDARSVDAPRRPARLLHLGPGRAPVGRDGRGDAARGGARRRGAHPSRGSARCTRSARRTPGTATAGRAGRSRCSRRASSRSSRPTSSRPEGRIHFAGEHCSLYHAWIQGALESGIRAAQAIHEASG